MRTNGHIIAIAALVLLTTGCEKVFFQPEPGSDPEAVFEDLYRTFKDNYGPTNERHVNWDSLYAVHRPQVNATSSDDALHTAITSMLATLDDGHVNLTAPGRPVFNANYIRNNKIGDGLFDLDVVLGHYLEGTTGNADDDGYVYGRIRNENLGYIWFKYVADNFFVLDEFLNANSSSAGIIIDLRHNDGGDFTFSFSSMGRLTGQERFVFRSRTINAPGSFTPWHDWYFEPDGNHFNKPIVVLTDRYTISAGERTVMALMTLPNTTFIGDTTCGAHSTMIGRELANGWYYTIATQNTLLPDGQCYEGIGLAPDITFINEQADMDNGIDRALEKAIEELQ